MELAVQWGYTGLTRDTVARRAGVAKGLVNYYFGNMDGLRRVIMCTAVEQECLPVIAQGLACNDPVAKAAPQWLRARAAMSLVW